MKSGKKLLQNWTLYRNQVQVIEIKIAIIKIKNVTDSKPDGHDRISILGLVELLDEKYIKDI